MKIAVLGYSGAGKSTLARTLGERYGIPVLHFDTIQFTPGWQERDRDEAHRMVHEFMEHPEWVIEGNYTKFEYERRLAEADKIIMVDLPRLACFVRAWKRYFRYRGKSRPRAVTRKWIWNSCGGFCGKAAPGGSGSGTERSRPRTRKKRWF